MHPSRRTVTQGLAAGLAGLALPAALAESALAAPRTAGADADILQRSLDALVAWPVVGAVCAVASPAGRLELAAGRRSAATPAPARPQSVARVASVTKAMTATLAFQEIERGTLRTFGDTPTWVSAFFAAFVCIFLYYLFWGLGVLACNARFFPVGERFKSLYGAKGAKDQTAGGPVTQPGASS